MPRTPDPILVATSSAHKAAELREVLSSVMRRELRTLADLDVPSPPEDIEIHDSFHANAVAKARYFARLTGLTVLSDDSGIVVDALDGLPGVRSKRFCSRTELKGEALDLANNALLLERLADTPAQHRTAHYACAAVWLDPARPPLCTLATVTGRIADAPAGDNGFGYDPIFSFPPLGVTFAQLDAATKNRDRKSVV